MNRAPVISVSERDMQVWERIANQEHRASFDTLPPLKAEESPLQDWIDRLWRWLDSLLPQQKIDPIPLQPLLPIALALLKLLLAVAVVIGLLLLIRAFFRRTGAKASSSGPPGPALSLSQLRSPLERFDKYLAEAEAKKDWALAGRIAWKRYLMLTELGEDLTPIEYSRHSGTTLQNLSDAYALMFSVSTSPEQHWLQWKVQLSDLAAKQGQNA